MNIFKKIKITIYGLSSGLTLNIVSKIFLSELIFLFAFPFINKNFLLKKYPELKYISYCFIFLFFSQILSDVFNESSFINFLKGTSMILFSYVSIIFFVSILNRNLNSLVYLLIGFVIINILKEDINFNKLFYDTNYFKSRIASFIVPLFILILYRLQKKIKLVLFLIFVFSITCFTFDARSLGLIFFFTGVIFYFKYFTYRPSRLKIVVLSFLFLVVSFNLYKIYVDNVSSGNFGGRNSQVQIALTSNKYNPFELLLYGRSDFVTLISVIKDKPLFGHGTWAKDVKNKYKQLNAQLLDRDISTLAETDQISYHSILLGAWAAYGLMGFISILLIFLKLFKTFWKHIFNTIHNPIFIISLIYFLSIIWDFFFSPLYTLRTAFPLTTALLIVYNHQIKFYKSNEKQSIF